MQTTRHILNIFLASPTDVNEERAMADEVVNSINKSIGRSLEWQIDLHKWEDTAPGIGRPQAKINSMVDGCDLFIGLLWKRWGQPSGEYSSGFEEEFERARARYKKDNTPEMWLVFKSIDPILLNDPGPHIQKILEFRKLQEQSREVLFKPVIDANDWKFKLHEWLVAHLVSLAVPLREAEQQPSAVPDFESPDATTIESASGEAHERAVPQQLKVLSALLNKTLQNGDLEFSYTDENPLKELDVARLFLFSTDINVSQVYERCFWHT
jgi:hypothetical protein